MKKYPFFVICVIMLLFICTPSSHMKSTNHAVRQISAAESTNSVRMAQNIDSLTVLVNKQYVLPSKYVPKNLTMANPKIVHYTISGKHDRNYVRKEVANPLLNLIKDSKKNGLDLWVSSAYRSFQYQKNLFHRNVTSVGYDKTIQVVAKAGRSEHQTGLSIDFTTKSTGFSLEENFEKTREGKWLKQNAHKYGFIMRYPKGKEKITGYNYEPWHFRYVGKTLAKTLYTKKITLEEYYSQL